MFPNESSSADILRYANAFPQNFQDDAFGNRLPARRLAARQPVPSNVATSATAQSNPIDQVPASRDATNERPASVAGAVAGDGECRLSQAQMLSTTHEGSKDGAEMSRHAAVENSLPGANDGDVKQSKMGMCEHAHQHPSSKSEALCQEGRREHRVGARAGPDSHSLLSPEAVFSASVISSSSCGTAQSPSHHRACRPATSSSSNSDSSCAQSLDTSATGGAGNADSLTITQDFNDSSELRIASPVCNIPGVTPASTVQGIVPISFNDITNVSDERVMSDDGPASNVGWGIPKGLGLRGGGESSLNAGTTSWGAQPGGGANPGNPAGTGWGGSSQGQGGTGNQGQWGSAANRSGATSQGSTSQQGAAGGASKGGSGQPVPQPGQQGPAPAPQAQQNGASTSWAQAAGKGLPAGPQGSAPSTSSTTATTTTTTATVASTTTTTPSTNTSTKQQLEQLSTMREALFSQDGWGGQHVNQDTGWDIPPSPEPGAKDGVPAWKPNVNNGTDLWEANLRNGGQPPPTQTQKTPWGHTPTTNIGGTWGEDDDIAESSNVWKGVPSNVGPAAPAGQWGANPTPAAGGMWGVPKKENDWVGGTANVASNWGDPRTDPRGDPRNMGSLDPRDMRGTNDPRELRGSGMLDPRDHMRGVVDGMRGDPRDMRSMGDMRGTDPMIRGDPRISGRLNPSVADGAMWGQPPQPPHHHGPHHQPNQPPGKLVGPGAAVNQWTGPPPKDMGMSGTGPKPSGWEEPSPPAQRRSIPNYDDGTSLWGNPSQQQARLGGKVSHWKEMPSSNMGRGGLQCPPGMPQSRLPGNAPGNIKADGPLWGHPPRNGSWGEGPHEAVGAGWTDDPKSGVNVGVGSWNENPLTPTAWVGGPKPNTSMNPGWVEDDSLQTWGPPPKQGHKPLSKDLLWASKQFRILVDRGYKKEDVESALRSSNMNFDDAQELLTAGRLNVEWRRHEDHSPFDLTSNHPSSGFPGQRFNPVAQQMPFAPPGGPGVSSTPGLMTNLGAGNPSLASINSMSPAIVQKILTQQPPPQQPPAHQQQFAQGSRGPQNQPSTAQLRMLVQQIQMAVQAGYLNHQILNQPLAPQTLILLNQLLQQIKVLQQLLQQQAVIHAQPAKSNSNAVLQVSVQITKTKQQINNLQNQIASQQAIYVKQQQQHHHMSQGPQPGDYKTSYHDPLASLHSNFTDLSISKEPQVSFQTQQSRLMQWKLPSVDKDGDGMNEFSRAPGSTTKPSLPQSHSSPNINPLLGQGDGTWSTVTRSASDTGWPDSSGTDTSGQPDNKEAWPVTSQSGSAAFTDLVPEFEPGKPWKMKSIEEDPSITPGSVHRSPLSLATIKDSEIFSGGSKTSPTVSTSVDTAVPPLSLSSSTWSFNPPSSTALSSYTSPLGKLGASKGPWGEAPPPTAVTSELWGAPMNKSRGPPPGLSSKSTAGLGGGVSSNGWGAVGGGHSSWGSGGSGNWGSTWLLLKNLTPQIDGSTLKTLCMQHGPLQNFHLYLNHSIALAKYSTREEANKAQGALNNCVLGNTTIFAESPGASEVQALLQHLGQQPGSSGGWGGLRAGAAPPTTKSSGSADAWAPWAAPGQSGGALWGAGQLEPDQHRATPSSLNSFLPGDLLGGESM
ncbi:protein Gawky isoform X2 [Bacillus rossius redtenbacheri]|uniref:protein Gawky isoform X2 n=1 Tax=Bacillus rossius redtenbacheri TaxID=93214 RepID=UPI002FDDEAC9